MISVVIRNKNQGKALEFLLRNLTERYMSDIMEIIVIDNLSTDNSEKYFNNNMVHDLRLLNNFLMAEVLILPHKRQDYSIVVMFSAHSYPVSHDFFKLIKQKFDDNPNLAGLRCLA